MIDSQFLFNVTASAGLCFLYSLALAFSLHPLRVFHVALGGVVAVAGYTMVLLSNHASWPITLAIPASIAVAIVLGIAIERLVYRPLYFRRASPLATAISSFAVYLVLVNSLAGLFSNQQTVLEGTGSGPEIGGLYLARPQLLAISAASVVFLSLCAGLQSRYGCAVRAMEDSPELLRACGWSTMTLRTVCTTVSSAIGGLTGCLLAWDSGIEPGMGMSGLLNALVVVVVAGPGSYKGLLPVSFLMALLQQTISYSVSPRWESAVSFAVLTAFLVFKPGGLFATRRRTEEVG